MKNKTTKKTTKKTRSPRGMKATLRTIAAIDATGIPRAKGFEKSSEEALATLKSKNKGKGKKKITDTIDAGGGIMVDVVEQVGSDQKDATVADETTEQTSATETKKAKKPRTPKADGKMSGLDAAYEVLKANGGEMTCQAIVDEMLAKGLWSTNGRTPAGTIYSAMIREIDDKPGESRFAKTGRGLFAAATKN